MAESFDQRLKRLVERIELIDSELADLREARKDVFAEAKAVGYDPATLRKVLARRGMSPAERGEADALLEIYEAALGGHAGAQPVPLRAGVAELAAELLAEQLDGMEDPARAAQVVEHVLALLDIRAEIAVLRLQERGRRKLAADEGFEAKQLALVVRWYEKCAKHGPEAMKLGEQVFRLYRGRARGWGAPTGRGPYGGRQAGRTVRQARAQGPHPEAARGQRCSRHGPPAQAGWVVNRRSRDHLDQVRAMTDQIRADVANPSLRWLARCEGGPVGVVGHCLLCEADQGCSSSLCVRESTKPPGMEGEARTLAEACGLARSATA
jgi:uncharacterized protein (UPF0335 family)